MNFFGHAAIARERDADPAHVFGAMLPDFASMARARLVSVEDARIAGAVALHHRTDELFHAHPVFVGMCARAVTDLEAAGVGRGGARAAAHVGIELLLDGVLLDDGVARTAYLGALRTEALVTWRDGDAAARFTELHGRLRAWGLPNGYRDPVFVAERIAGALARRPRLALDAA